MPVSGHMTTVPINNYVNNTSLYVDIMHANNLIGRNFHHFGSENKKFLFEIKIEMTY